MRVLVTVVAHKEQRIKPSVAIGIVDIRKQLVNHCLGIRSIDNRHTSNGNIHLVAVERIGSLAIVQHTVEAIVNITIDKIERFLALKSKQIIVGIVLSAKRSFESVVPYTATKQQEILRLFGLRRGSVVQHLEIVAIGRGIRCAT